MVSWDDLRVFLAVRRHRTHAAAARALGVDPTTVGRRVVALERALGATLFQRTPSGVALTAEGAALVPRAERIEAEVFASERAIGGADARLSGTVRLTAGDGLVTHVIVPRLVDLLRAHPDIDVELSADNRPLDLSRREADVAVRLFRPREEALVARRLGVMDFAIYGSEAYFARRGRPRRDSDLERHDWIDYDAASERLPPSQWLRRKAPGARVAVRANTTTAIVAACVSGHGLSLLATQIAATQQELVRVPIRTALPSRDVWAVSHADLRASARIKALLGWLTDVFSRDGSAKPPPVASRPPLR